MLLHLHSDKNLNLYASEKTVKISFIKLKLWVQYIIKINLILS